MTTEQMTEEEMFVAILAKLEEIGKKADDINRKTEKMHSLLCRRDVLLSSSSSPSPSTGEASASSSTVPTSSSTSTPPGDATFVLPAATTELPPAAPTRCSTEGPNHDSRVDARVPASASTSSVSPTTSSTSSPPSGVSAVIPMATSELPPATPARCSALGFCQAAHIPESATTISAPSSVSSTSNPPQDVLFADLLATTSSAVMNAALIWLPVTSVEDAHKVFKVMPVFLFLPPATFYTAWSLHCAAELRPMAWPPFSCSRVSEPPKHPFPPTPVLLEDSVIEVRPAPWPSFSNSYYQVEMQPKQKWLAMSIEVYLLWFNASVCNFQKLFKVPANSMMHRTISWPFFWFSRKGVFVQLKTPWPPPKPWETYMHKKQYLKFCGIADNRRHCVDLFQSNSDQMWLFTEILACKIILLNGALILVTCLWRKHTVNFLVLDLCQEKCIFGCCRNGLFQSYLQAMLFDSGACKLCYGWVVTDDLFCYSNDQEMVGFSCLENGQGIFKCSVRVAACSINNSIFGLWQMLVELLLTVMPEDSKAEGLEMLLQAQGSNDIYHKSNSVQEIARCTAKASHGILPIQHAVLRHLCCNLFTMMMLWEALHHIQSRSSLVEISNALNNYMVREGTMTELAIMVPSLLPLTPAKFRNILSGMERLPEIIAANSLSIGVEVFADFSKCWSRDANNWLAIWPLELMKLTNTTCGELLEMVLRNVHGISVLTSQQHEDNVWLNILDPGPPRDRRICWHWTLCSDACLMYAAAEVMHHMSLLCFLVLLQQEVDTCYLNFGQKCTCLLDEANQQVLMREGVSMQVFEPNLYGCYTKLLGTLICLMVLSQLSYFHELRYLRLPRNSGDGLIRNFMSLNCWHHRYWRLFCVFHQTWLHICAFRLEVFRMLRNSEGPYITTMDMVCVSDLWLQRRRQGNQARHLDHDAKSPQLLSCLSVLIHYFSKEHRRSDIKDIEATAWGQAVIHGGMSRTNHHHC